MSSTCHGEVVLDSKKTYQVIARKYRPQTLSQVIGQEPITTTLKNALLSQRLAHAYLFCGCRGTGKTTLARIFAKALNCQMPTSEGEPCNLCPSCLDITSGNALDVSEIDGASHRGIDDIRQINETVNYAPSTRYKIYIIDEVHMLTKEAFNALLKTLEEPPPHVKFIFATTEPHKVLPTILSRCQRFDLQRIAPNKIADKLKAITQDLQMPCDEAIFPLIANLAQGSLRDAESLLDQLLSCGEPPFTLEKISNALGMLSQSVFADLDEAFHNQNLAFAFELSSSLFAAGKDLTYFLEQLLEHYRSHLKSKMHQEHGSQPPLKTNSFYTQEECLYILDFLIKAEQMSLKIPFKRVHLEMTLLHILRSKNRITLPVLIQRLEALEKNRPLESPPIAEPRAVLKPLVAAEEIKAALPIASPTIQAPEPIQLAPLQEEINIVPSPVEQAVEKIVPPKESAVEKKGQCHYDTLLRFAAVELEGIIKPY